jgi:hypothetical protein
MKDTILLGKYKFLWKERNNNVIVAEIRHYVENKFGGSLETPIGNLICYKEDYPIFWRINIVLRDDIEYSQTRNRIFVISKPAYKRKLEYYFDKLKDIIFPRFRADKELNEEIKKYLIKNNLISEPFSISRSIEKNESFEFVGKLNELD